MKLIRFGDRGEEKPGLIDENGNVRDLSGVTYDICPETISPALLSELGKLKAYKLPLVNSIPRIGPCIARVGNFIAVGLNYAGVSANGPTEPILYNKAPSALCGPSDPVVIPKGSTKTDWEVELAVIISRRAHNIAEAEALSHVAGYCICNDITERAWMTEGTGQWTKGKSSPTFGPLGPWLVTTDEIPDPQNLAMFLDVNGQRYQSASTRTMIFGVKYLVAYASKFMALEPGDVITTGSPPGVGYTLSPQVFLKPGDIMRLGVEGLGEQLHQCKPYPSN